MLIFLSLPIASKHSVFPLTKVSAAKVRAILHKFGSTELKRVRRPLYGIVLGRQAVFMWRTSVRLVIGGQEKHPANDFAQEMYNLSFSTLLHIYLHGPYLIKPHIYQHSLHLIKPVLDLVLINSRLLNSRINKYSSPPSYTTYIFNKELNQISLNTTVIDTAKRVLYLTRPDLL